MSTKTKENSFVQQERLKNINISLFCWESFIQIQFGSITFYKSGGACTLYEEAREFDVGNYYGAEAGEEFNEEADGPCSVWEECCKKACYPEELGYEEC